ncbi:Cytochrome B5-like protein [Rhynchospora pubera]|uniref:Cytochrome B5-like protein n=1 Tax=Rhynchospora pubera TaxID=906938 RepID=A0AAV8FG17_9POAL|nr:Cytochrome B5-like protein [Rhynchospora pubera]
MTMDKDNITLLLLSLLSALFLLAYLFPKPKSTNNNNNNNKGRKFKHAQSTANANVYDVTSYVEEHPGGDAILNNAGRDSTQGFYGPQHATRVFDMVDEFYIGDLKN